MIRESASTTITVILIQSSLILLKRNPNDTNILNVSTPHLHSTAV